MWEDDGRLCPVGDSTDSALLACNMPLDCCNFRTSYGCGGSPLSQGELVPLCMPTHLASLHSSGFEAFCCYLPGAPLPLPVSPPASLPPATVQYVLPAFEPLGLPGLPISTVTTQQANASTTASISTLTTGRGGPTPVSSPSAGEQAVHTDSCWDECHRARIHLHVNLVSV